MVLQRDIALLRRVDADLPRDLEQRLLVPAAMPALLQILDDELAGCGEATRFAAIHAVSLLTEARALSAIPRLLALLARTEWDDPLHDQILVCLPTLGVPVLGPALDALDSAVGHLRDSLCEVIARLGVRSDRILAALRDQLATQPSLAAVNLVAYGDPAGLQIVATDETLALSGNRAC